MSIVEPIGDRAQPSHSVLHRLTATASVERIYNARDGCAATRAPERISFEARAIKTRKRRSVEQRVRAAPRTFDVEASSASAHGPGNLWRIVLGIAIRVARFVCVCLKRD